MNISKIFIAISLGIFAYPSSMAALDLTPEQCSIGNRPEYSPISEVSFTFDRAIRVVDNANANIYGEDSCLLATGKISSSNYIGIKDTQGTMIVSFESPLTLPKGKSYTLAIPEHTVYSQEDASVSNGELIIEFYVPDSLEIAHYSLEDGSILSTANRIGFYFTTETAAVEGREIILCREDTPVRTYSCNASWDWDLGYAGVDFGEHLNFEAGVRYSIILPEGSVCALNRSDIMNEELRLNFIGGYENSKETIEYVWCSLYDNHPTDVIGKVEFFYNEEIALCRNPKIQLVSNDNEIEKEVVPSLTYRDAKWILIADFEDFSLKSGKGYSVVIPEGTIVTPNGDVVVNSRNALSLCNSSAVKHVSHINPRISILDGYLNITGIDCGSDITVYSMDGNIVYSSTVNSTEVNTTLPGKGIYILSINGWISKIINQ